MKARPRLMSQRLSRGALWELVPALLFASGAHAADGLAFLQILRNGTGGVDGLKGARGIAVSADGTSLYATGNEDAAVAVFRRDPASGELAFIGRERNDVDGVQGLDRAYGVAVSPDGGRVY